MGYDIQIFHRDVKNKVETGLALDAFKHPELEKPDHERFLLRVVKYGYVLESETKKTKTFTKGKITVMVFDALISFSVPYGTDSDALFDALQDASELADSSTVALFNPQENEWTVC